MGNAAGEPAHGVEFLRAADVFLELVELGDVAQNDDAAHRGALRLGERIGLHLDEAAFGVGCP